MREINLHSEKAEIEGIVGGIFPHRIDPIHEPVGDRAYKYPSEKGIKWSMAKVLTGRASYRYENQSYMLQLWRKE